MHSLWTKLTIAKATSLKVPGDSERARGRVWGRRKERLEGGRKTSSSSLAKWALITFIHSKKCLYTHYNLVEQRNSPSFPSRKNIQLSRGLCLSPKLYRKCHLQWKRGKQKSKSSPDTFPEWPAVPKAQEASSVTRAEIYLFLNTLNLYLHIVSASGTCVVSFGWKP